MLNAETMQNGGVQVAQVYGILGNVVTEIVTGTVGNAGLDAATSQPYGKAPTVMIATAARITKLALAEDRSAEFGEEQYQGIFQQPARLQILDQRGRGLIDIGTLFGQLLRQCNVLIPTRWNNCTNRTSRSISRRASRQLRA